jgi:lipopolysaccharide export system permease protein
MKKILFRKLFLDFMSFFFIALVAASIVIWVFQAVNYLDIMIEDGRDYLIYVYYSLLNFPKIFSKLFPFVLFFSIFYVTTRYEQNNEMIIFWNFGINKIEIINFVFKISIFLIFIQYILTAFIVPKSQDLARSFLRTSTVNFLGNFVKPQRFNDTIKGVTIYSEKRDTEGNLENVYVKKDIGKNEFQITYAKNGFFKDVKGKPILVLIDGQQLTGNNQELRNISFSKSDFSLQKMETNTTTYKKTQEISTSELFTCFNGILNLGLIKISNKIKKIENCSLANLENLLQEFYKRLIIPLYIPLLSLIPLLLITSSKELKNYNRIKVCTFLVGLTVIILSETSIRFISEQFIENIILTFSPIISFLLIYIIFYYKFSFRLRSKQ